MSIFLWTWDYTTLKLRISVYQNIVLREWKGQPQSGKRYLHYVVGYIQNKLRIPTNQKEKYNPETTQMSLNWRMDKQNMVICTIKYNSAIKRNEILVRATASLNLENILSKNRDKRSHIVWFHIYEISWQIQRHKADWWLLGVGEGGE